MPHRHPPLHDAGWWALLLPALALAAIIAAATCGGTLPTP